MYLSPNFEIEEDENSSIITPQINEDGIVDKYMIVEQLGVGKTPITLSEKIDKSKIILAELDSLNKMYLYPNGEIKIER